MTTGVSRYASDVLSPGVVGVGEDAVGNKKQEAFDRWIKNAVTSDKRSRRCRANAILCDDVMLIQTDARMLPNKEGREEELEYYSDEEVYSDEEEQGEPEMIDLEEMGNSMMAVEKATEVREMVTPSHAAALN